MIAVIRISGQVQVRQDVKETLFRMRLRKKYTCVILEETKENLGKLRVVSNYVAFGKISKETLEKLIEARAKPLDKTKKLDAKKIAEELEKGKRLEELNVKPFFGLHPARGGIDSKYHFGETKKGVLGNNQERIGKLIERML